MQGLFQRFLRNLQRSKVREEHAHAVAIALSGGPDSMALAAMTALWHKNSSPSTVSRFYWNCSLAFEELLALK